MAGFSMPVQIRWSDLDPNFHLRHSVYYDWGAMSRINFLYDHGLTPAFMQEHLFGPIIFREEAVFRKEIKPGDAITITLALGKSKRDFSRWTIVHQIMKGDTLCAVLTVDGAWIHIEQRKLFIPPPTVARVFEQMPKAPEFAWIDK